MAQTMRFRIGAGASCTDGACGQVSRIIVNPVTREVGTGEERASPETLGRRWMGVISQSQSGSW